MTIKGKPAHWSGIVIIPEWATQRECVWGGREEIFQGDRMPAAGYVKGIRDDDVQQSSTERPMFKMQLNF